jgi:hypothetical protein
MVLLFRVWFPRVLHTETKEYFVTGLQIVCYKLYSCGEGEFSRVMGDIDGLRKGKFCTL